MKNRTIKPLVVKKFKMHEWMDRHYWDILTGSVRIRQSSMIGYLVFSL